MKLSVVVPCFNEEDGIERLAEALSSILPALVNNFEVILIDDGSQDSTLEKLRIVSRTDKRFRFVAFSRNFGKEAAMLAGMKFSTGDAVAILDADLQHPPELLEKMLPQLKLGFDQVIARRTREGDNFFRTLASRTYYRVMNRLVDVRLEDGVGDFRLLSRKAVDALLALTEYNRFSKGLFAWIGFPTTVIDYGNVLRESGKSKWSFRSLVNYGIDGIISFNSKPLRTAIHFGVLVVFLGTLYGVWAVVNALIGGVSVPGYVTTICAVILFGGLNMLMIGVLGEYLGRIYMEVKNRPHFLYKETSEVASQEEFDRGQTNFTVSSDTERHLRQEDS